MQFSIEFTTIALKDLKRFSISTRRAIVENIIKLESEPFPEKKKVRRIQGIKFPCYRLGIDFQTDSFRVFYGIDQGTIIVLRIVSKKNADKIIKSIRKLNFPPDI